MLLVLCQPRHVYAALCNIILFQGQTSRSREGMGFAQPRAAPEALELQLQPACHLHRPGSPGFPPHMNRARVGKGLPDRGLRCVDRWPGSPNHSVGCLKSSISP